MKEEAGEFVGLNVKMQFSMTEASLLTAATGDQTPSFGHYFNWTAEAASCDR